MFVISQMARISLIQSEIGPDGKDHKGPSPTNMAICSSLLWTHTCILTMKAKVLCQHRQKVQTKTGSGLELLLEVSLIWQAADKNLPCPDVMIPRHRRYQHALQAAWSLKSHWQGFLVMFMLSVLDLSRCTPHHFGAAHCWCDAAG